MPETLTMPETDHLATDDPRPLRVAVEMTDLWRDPDGGWSANCAWVRRATVTLPPGLSDLAASRRILAAIGGQGFRRDDWSGADWSWRAGAVGISADVLPD